MKLKVWIAQGFNEDGADDMVVGKTRMEVLSKALNGKFTLTSTKKVSIEYSNSFDLFAKLNQSEPPIETIIEYDAEGVRVLSEPEQLETTELDEVEEIDGNLAAA